MKKELKSGILSADKSADHRPTVGGANVIAVLHKHVTLTLILRNVHVYDEGNLMDLLTIRNGNLPYVVQNERYASSCVSV